MKIEINSDILLKASDDELERIVPFVEAWNAVIMSYTIPKGTTATVFGGRGAAREALMEAIENARKWEEPKVFIWEIDGKKEASVIEELKTEGTTEEELLKARNDAKTMVLVCHLINENEHGDIKNPALVIPEETCMLSSDGCREYARWYEEHGLKERLYYEVKGIA